MPLHSDALSAVITYVAAVLEFTLVREHRTCVGAFNLKPLR